MYTGEIKMAEECQFTISSFYKFIDENKLMGAKCGDCGAVILPPKPMCTNCLSANLDWIEIEGSAKLVSYTTIYVAPEQFQSMVPYSVGIVEFSNGARLPGMVSQVKPEELKVGMDLKLCFNTSTSDQWPAWSRYFFKPA